MNPSIILHMLYTQYEELLRLRDLVQKQAEEIEALKAAAKEN